MLLAVEEEVEESPPKPRIRAIENGRENIFSSRG